MYRKRMLGIVLGLMLLMTLVSTAAAQPFTLHSSVAATGDDLSRTDVELAREFARLPIGKGSELVFYAMLGAPEREEDSNDDAIKRIGSDATLGGRIHGVSVGMYIPAGGMDPATVRELEGANPHEIFHAFSERGTEIPALLREQQKNRFKRHNQGWALDVVKPNLYNIAGCKVSEESVVNAVNATGLPHSYNALSDGPHNSPFWYPEDPNSLFPTYYQNNGLATVGDAYFQVMLCDEDPMFDQTSVAVRLTYEESDDDVVLSTGELHWQLHNPGDQMSFLSWPFDSDLSGDNTWFWMLTVSDVHYHDTLHIGTAWS
ncbi:MAG: hypothetical protein R3A46_11235 [Thermomicrobiales bacterium]